MTAPGAGGVGDGGAGAAPGGAPEAAGAAPGVEPTQESGSGFIDLNGLEIPPELHGHMGRYIKEKIDPVLTQKFQELAEQRKPYEAFSGIEGLSDVPAEELSELLAFRKTASDPEKFGEWYTGFADTQIEENPEGFEAWWKERGEKLGYTFDGDDEPTDPDLEPGGDSEEVAALRAEMQAFKDEFGQKETQREEQQRVEARTGEINKQMVPFVESLGDMPDEEKTQAINDVYGLALKYGDEEPDQQIPKAIADWQRIKGIGEAGLIDKRLGHPDPALNGGAPADTTDPVRGFDHANQIAKDRLRAAA